MAPEPPDSIDASRDDVLRYLAAAQAYWGRYHDHKETSAWAAVVLYAALSGALVSGLRDAPPASPLRWIAVVVGLVLMLATLHYFNRQNMLLNRGGSLTHASLYLWAEYLSAPADRIPAVNMKPLGYKNPGVATSGNRRGFKGICRFVFGVDDLPTESRWSTPKALEDVIKDQGGRGKQAGLPLKWIARGFVMLTYLTSVMMLLDP